MDIKADIKWIQDELDKIRDPELIQVFKQLLLFSKKNRPATLSEYNDDILAAEEDINAGKCYSQDDINEAKEGWKESLSFGRK